MHFIGPSGIGKTTTRKRLVGSITNLFQLPENERKPCSTRLAEYTQALSFVDLYGKKRFQASKDLTEETQLIFSYLMASEPIKDINDSTNSISQSKEKPKESQATSTNPSKESTDEDKQKSDKKATETKAFSPTTERKEVMTGSVTADDVQMVVKTLREIVGGSKDYKEKLKDKVLLNLVDIGGQPGFVEMFPFLSRGAGIFLAFLRLDKDLDKICQVSYERGNDKIVPYDSTYTNREMLSQILSAITHYNVKDKELCGDDLGLTKPIAAVIGTFKDELAMQIKVDIMYEKCFDTKNTAAANKCDIKKNTADKSTAADTIDGTIADKSDSTTADEHKKAIRLILTQDSQKKSDDEQPNVTDDDMAAIQQTVSQHLDSDAFKKEVEDQIEQKLREKNEAVSKVTRKFKIFSDPIHKKIIAVDNYKGTDPDIDPFRDRLCSMISGYKDATFPIRPKQLLLGVALRNKYDIVSINSCIHIGEEGLKMSEDEVRFTIEYLDRCVGALIYRPDIKDKDGYFEKFVICDPQVVFNSLSDLVVTPLLELHSEKKNDQFSEDEIKNWTDRGQFSLQTICKCELKGVKKNQLIPVDKSEESKGVKKGQLIPVEKLLILLEHSHLLATITTVVKDSHTTEKEETTYFFPAILKCASHEELAKQPPTGIDTPPPIKITFDPQYVPIGTFCAMISELVSRGSKKILGMTWKLVDSSVKRNLVSFHVDTTANHVVLIAHVDCYEIRIIQRNHKFEMHNFCSYVLSTVLFVMKDISHPRLTPIIAFDCKCGKQKDSSKLCLLNEQEVFPCFNCTCVSFCQKYWFAKVSKIIIVL